ncbi:thioredoxin family protein [Sulfobacillus sp. DSM 109850]|uniref:Thioredoxin family protein n=1 Tax=Sulfobacillus harzensis TaxID=2729629 RepID=A0A7Y0Q507_9FIRM|nr:thioredoxin family protein [Sulfobacillus harzensis]
MAAKQPAHVIFFKVDVDENPELARQYDVQAIPAMIKIENGEDKGRLIGYRSESEIQQFING